MLSPDRCSLSQPPGHIIWVVKPQKTIFSDERSKLQNKICTVMKLAVVMWNKICGVIKFAAVVWKNRRKLYSRLNVMHSWFGEMIATMSHHCCDHSLLQLEYTGISR